MADQPATPPAPDGKTPQGTPPEPVTPPADAPAVTTAISFDSFSDDDKKYLAGQGITKQEDLTQDSLVKLINHGRSSQKTAAEIKAELDKIKPATPQVPGVPTGPQAPANPAQPAAPSPTPDAAVPKEIDRVTAFTLANQLAGNFPALKEDLISGKFYQDMAALHIPTMINGEVNLDGMLAFGKNENERREAIAKLAEVNKPGEGAIPDANAGKPAPVADNAPMTKQIALAIAAHVSKGGETHPRADEAKQFLQKNIG